MKCLIFNEVNLIILTIGFNIVNNKVNIVNLLINIV